VYYIRTKRIGGGGWSRCFLTPCLLLLLLLRRLLFSSRQCDEKIIQTAYLGHKLGWYAALREAARDGLTPVELASLTNSSERYAQEWLEHQCTSGWVQCLNPYCPSGRSRKFALPKSHASVLADVDSLSYLTPLAVLTCCAGTKLDDLAEAYRTDGGVSWNDLGDVAREGMAAANRPFFLQQLPRILETILGPEASRKLKTPGGDGRVADIGAGYAWSSIGVAKHFSASTVDSFDVDEPSVRRAQKLIEAEGLSDRVVARCVDVSSSGSTELVAGREDGDGDDPYDLVMAMECVHDLSDPIGVLRTMRRLANGNGKGRGTVVVMDEKVADDFASGIGDPVERLCYGFSCTCCLASSKSTPSSSSSETSSPSPSKASAATGAVMRPSVLKAYAQQAGFKDVEICLEAEHDFFRFYKLVG